MIDAAATEPWAAARSARAYYLDHVPVRGATSVTGHAVRQLYLLCGATDVAIETGDAGLLAAIERLWDDAYLDENLPYGGHESRHRDELFGDPYELPPDRADNETCAAIASVMWNWRLLLATGLRRYADELERALYNAVAVGLSADGTHFFYSNPLQLRAGHDGSSQDSPSGRRPGYDCACCPPNLARLGASLHHYVATGGGSGIQLHLFAAGQISVELDADRSSSRCPRRTRGRGRSGSRWCSLRPPRGTRPAPAGLVPGRLGVRRRPRRWPRRLPAGPPVLGARRRGYPRARHAIHAISAHPAVDAVRGCVGLQRGPLVYCLEQRD